jgi:hypothetical protein
MISQPDGIPPVTGTAKTEAYLRERASRGDLGAFDDWLRASPDVAPVPGDEI